MATVAELVFKAAFGDLVEAKGVLGELKAKTEETQAAADKMGESLSLASKASLAIGAAIGTGIGAIAALTKHALDAADEMNKMSQKVGVSTETLSGWAYGASLADVSSEKLQKGLVGLAEKMEKVAGGNKEATNLFDTLGLSATDATGNLKSTEDMMYQVADRFKEMEDGAGKTALAAELFGKKVGPDLIPFLNQGSEGIKGLNAEALKFGLIIKQETAAKAEEFNDTLERMKGVAGGMGTQIAAGLLPTLQNLATMFLDTAKDGNSMDVIIKGLDTTLKILASTIVGVVGVLKTLGAGLGAIAAAMVQAAHGDFAEAWKTLKAGAEDAKEGFANTGKSIVKVWDETASTVNGKADDHSDKLAAPIVKTVPKVKKAAKEVVSELEKFVAELEKQVATFGQSNEVMDEYLLKQKLMSEKNAEKRKALEEEAKLLILQKGLLEEAKDTAKDQADAEAKQIEAMKKKDAAAKKEADNVQKLIEKYEEIGDPTRKYAEQLSEIEMLMIKYPEHADALAKAQVKITEEMYKSQDATKDLKDKQTDLMKELIQAAEGYGKKMGDAFVDWISGAKGSFSDMVRSMLTDMAKLLMYQGVVKPLMKQMGGMFGGIFDFHNGGVFNAPTAYADGLLTSPTMFGMGGGKNGIAGESGAEAIIPLKRDANGRLGVSGGGGQTVQVGDINININGTSAKDAPEVGRAAHEGVDRALRGLIQNELVNQTRTGNLFSPMPLKGF